MLGDRDAIATIAVRDIEVARRFYKDTLGLKPLPSPEETVLSFKSGTSTLFVYQSDFAGTNEATAVTWVVGDEVRAIAQELRSRGVKFEKYDMPGMTLEGDVHVAGAMAAAWFKDPDGNILSFVNGPAGT
jgi:catechol 2,3-dioxygenase-like lactoylglutathione lyase family enzyme